MPESIEAHRKSFGRAPYLLSGDRGLYSIENEKLAHEAGIKHVLLPKSGKASKERQRYEKQRWFRAGIEGRISVLRRSHGRGRCLDHGEEGMERWVGRGIFVHNLSKISQVRAERAAA